jgi:uncharacterized OsmC-like protein
MGSIEIATAVAGAREYLTAHPDEARYRDSAATAVVEDGLRVRVEGPDGASLVTDMVSAVGGGGSAPSPAWLFRAGYASCVATLITMAAATEGVELTGLQVTVDSESDDRGILGIDESVPAGPLSLRVDVRIASATADEDRVREIVDWGRAHCPVDDLARRAVPVEVAVEVG